jgi:septal ring factor EnvC (AmiA/AmiB activator)
LTSDFAFVFEGSGRTLFSIAEISPQKCYPCGALRSDIARQDKFIKNQIDAQQNLLKKNQQLAKEAAKLDEKNRKLAEKNKKLEAKNREFNAEKKTIEAQNADLARKNDAIKAAQKPIATTPN